MPQTRFKVYGADARTGQEVAVTITADNQAEAEAIASVRHIMVSRVTELEAAFEVPPMPPSPPVPASKSQVTSDPNQRTCKACGHVGVPKTKWHGMIQLCPRCRTMLPPSPQPDPPQAVIDKYSIICANCGDICRPKKVAPGSLGVEGALWVTFMVPGMIYSAWRMTSKYKVCSKCGSRELLPLNSSRGRQIRAELEQFSTPTDLPEVALASPVIPGKSQTGCGCILFAIVLIIIIIIIAHA